MANIKIPNLCGANAEFNSVQSKFESLLSDAVSGLESTASSLSSTLDSAVTSLTTDLRDLMPEVPSLPDVNLQSLLTSLSSLTPGTPEYITLLAEITTKFGTELTAAGKSLDTLVTNARTQIEGGGDLCSVVPNFTKAADGLTDAKEKSSESKQPNVDALQEKTSTLIKNAEVVAQRTGLGLRVKKMITEASTAEDVVVDTVTSTTPPTSDTGAFTVTETTRGFGFDVNTIKVTTPASQDGKNITTAGFARRKTRAKERFKDSDVTQSGDTWTIKLSHTPVGVSTLTGNCLITRASKEVQAWVHIVPKGEPNVLSIGSRNQGRAFYEVDGQTIKITGRGHDFFPHSDKHTTHFHSYLEDVEFQISYDYFANYDPGLVKV
tara:strand:+ start:1291 stop:2427 length:1137 start_codon:yes stop_codon:yes gene_type:complete